VINRSTVIPLKMWPLYFSNNEKLVTRKGGNGNQKKRNKKEKKIRVMFQKLKDET